MTIDFGACQAVLLDCCSLLNLYASRRLADILQVLPVRCAVADVVIGEATYVLRGGDGDDAAEREAVDLRPFIAFGRVEVWHLETDAEFTSFVELAAEIDDGEAVTCALSFHRAGAVVTDDRKTLRVMARAASRIPIFTTSQLLEYWTESTNADNDSSRAMLLDIQMRARFVPGKQDPLLAWWESLIRDP